MLKRAVALTVVLAFCLQVPGIAYPALTDPDDLSKGIKLGLDLATATAENKSSIEAAKKVAQKELDDWTWKYVVANYETLLTQNADAEIPDFREKINKLQEFIERVGQVATQLGEGKYDEAAFTAVDQAVATFDHPVITVLWASVKLTYESHKLVQSTKAELQIEALYGKVNNDRLLLGAFSDDGPKQIQVNSEAVDRFFHNYLIKDDDTRALMKAYVKGRLGQDWPELPITDWVKSFTLLGTGIDSEKSYEIEQLTEFKNVSRQWITALLNDINKQVKVEWAATRVRQQKAEFDAYAAKMKGFSAEQIVEFFKKRKEMLKAKQEFPKFLADSIAAYQKLSNEFGSLKPTQVTRMQEIYSSAVSYKGTAENYSKMALMVDDLPLSNELEKQSIIWGQFADKIIKSVRANQQNADDAVVEAAVSASDTNKASMSCYGTFSPSIPVFTFSTKDPEQIYKEVMDLLNSGNMQEARKNIDDWYSTELSKAAETYDASLTALAKAAQLSPPFNNGVYFEVWRGRDMKNPIEITQKTNTGTMSQGRSWGYVKAYVAFEKLFECAVAGPIADEAAWAAYSSFQGLISIEAGRMNELYSAFGSLAKQRAEELAVLRSRLNRIYSDLDMSLSYDDFKPDTGRIKSKPAAVNDMEEAQKYLRDNTYTYLGNLDLTGYGLVSIDGYMEQKAAEIMSVAANLESYVTYFDSTAAKVVETWNEGINNVLSIEKPDSETVNEFIVLADRQYDHEREFLSALERAGVIQSYTGNFPNTVKNFAASSQTEINNRIQDADYLRAMATQWRTWLNMQMENGIFERNYTPTGIPILNDNFDGDLRIKPTSDSYMDFTSGMLIMYKPYFHYATDKEIKSLPQAQKARQDLQKFQVYSFINSHMPSYASKLESLLSGSNITPAKEDNFFLQNNKNFVIYRSGIGKADELIKALDPEKDDFISKLKEISILLPGTLIAQTSDEVREQYKDKFFGEPQEFSRLVDMDRSEYSGHEMGKEYLALLEKLSPILDKRRDYLLNILQKKAEEQSILERIKYFTDEINKMSNEIDALPESSITIDKTNMLYTDFFKLYNSYLSQNLSGLDALFKGLEDKILSLKSRFEGMEDQKIQQVKDLYSSFKQAYEERNDALLISFLGDDWEAGDGTTLSDLQVSFFRTFRAFDEIRYSLQNMKIEKHPLGGFVVTYDVTITSRIYSRGIKHEEKSSVSELVNINNGRAKITRTLNGRFWYVE